MNTEVLKIRVRRETARRTLAVASPLPASRLFYGRLFRRCALRQLPSPQFHGWLLCKEFCGG